MDRFLSCIQKVTVKCEIARNFFLPLSPGHSTKRVFTRVVQVTLNWRFALHTPIISFIYLHMFKVVLAYLFHNLG